MNYGILKVDTIIYTSGGLDGTISVSGLGEGSFNSISASGGVLTASGTAAQPSVSFIADPDTGLFNAGANVVAITTSGSERLRVDSSGRLGLGTSSPGVTLDVVGGSDAIAYRVRGRSSDNIGAIQFTDNGATTQYASIQTPAANTLSLLTASTERLRIDSSGNVGIGTTSPKSILTAAGNIVGLSTGTHSWQHYQQASSSYTVTSIDSVIDGAAGNLIFKTGPNWTNADAVERARIDSSGRLLVGTSSALANVSILGGASLASTTPIAQIATATNSYNAGLSLTNYSLSNYGSVLSLNSSRSNTLGTNASVIQDAGVGFVSFNGNDGNNFIPCAQIGGFVDGTPGTNDMPGRLVFSTTADGASSPTERMRITEGGDILIGKSSLSGGVPGTRFFGSSSIGAVDFTRSAGRILLVNRLTDDGILVELAQDNTVEGTISVSGTTVSYNGAHLSRWSQIPGIDPYDKTDRPEILRGTVMSNLDEMCDWIDPESGEAQNNEQLNKTKISDVEGDKNAAGVFQSWDDDDDTWVNDYYLAMTGDFVIRIAAGVTVQRGDLLMSAGDGTAKPQDDDIIRSKTIAKVISTTVSCTHPDGSYCVPCVLMAC